MTDDGGETNEPQAMTGVVLADRYRLLRVLGSGAMSHVFEAEQVGLARSVAVKMLRQSGLATAAGRERFRTEALAASRVNHPNAVGIFDLGVTENGIPYLVMELLRGRPLAQIVAEEPPLAPARVVSIGTQILAAVEEAHGCGVIHCDLKTENVVVEPLRDGSDFVKVLDFGIARLIDRPASGGPVLGTPEFMAPEQIRGEAVTAATDIYATGILLYELIVGRTPFAGASTQVVLDRHLKERPVPPHEVVLACPPALSVVVMTALEKDPGRRFPSAVAMRRALAGVLAGTAGLRRCPACREETSADLRFCGHCGADLGVSAALPAPGAGVAARPRSGTLQFDPRSAEMPRAVVAPDPLTGRPTRLAWTLARAHRGLTGRSDEMERLASFVRGQVAASTLALVGPAGIGKARLVVEAGRRTAPDVTTFITAPDPSGYRSSWYPILSLLEAVLGLPPHPGLDALRQAVARCGLPERDVPGLAEVFGLPGSLSTLETEPRRREARAAVVRALRSVERRHPQSLFGFIDLDKYDRPSRELVASLTEAVIGSAVRILVTVSDEEAVPAGATPVWVAGMPAHEAHELALRVCGGSPDGLPTPEALRALTGGSPAGVEQVAGWIRSGNRPEGMPGKITDLIGARLGRLPTAARRVLQAVAAYGQIAPRGPLEAVLTDLDPTGQGVETLVEAGLLHVGERDFTIPLEIVVGVMAACTPADVRRTLGERALAAMGPHTPPSWVAQHAELAGQLERAAGGCLAAGDDAVRRFDDRGGAAWFGRAAGHGRRLLLQGESSGERIMVEASVKLSDALLSLGETALALGALEEAEMAGPTVAERVSIARARGRVALKQGNPAAAVRHAQVAAVDAASVGDLDTQCEASIELGRALLAVGDLQAAQAGMKAAQDMFLRSVDRRDAPQRLWLLGFRLAEMTLRRGDAGGAEKLAVEALRHAERVASSIGQGRLHALLATIAQARRNDGLALEHRARAADIMRRIGDRRSTAELLIACARATGEFPVLGTTGSTPGRPPVDPREAMRIARELAQEIGWKEGVAIAQRRAAG